MKANLMTKKIEMTKTEAKAAGILNSDAYKELKAYRKAYPDFEISIRETPKRKTANKGLDYDYMRKYIAKHDDENKTLMNEFNTLIAQDKKDKKEGSENLRAASYIDVKNWFKSTFPEIEKYRDEHSDKVKKILNKVA